MHGLMMDNPLLISSIVEHADINFPDREIVSVTNNGSLHRYTYKECFIRVSKLVNDRPIVCSPHREDITRDPRS